MNTALLAQTMRRLRRRVVLFLGLVALSVSELQPAALAADSPTGAAGNRWAVLIGASKYHRANPLKYTVNDVHQLGGTLRNRGQYEADRVLEMTDDVSNPRFQPLKTNILSELPKWLKRIGEKDSLLVYFSGHGFRDKQDDKLYLAPLDCDPENAAATGVSVEWLREQIAGCKAQFKLLILDACHAGSEKGEDETATGVAAKDLGEQFKGLEGIVTLASSDADEKSQLWDDKEQSLFTYWLNQGLKGHADKDGDSEVDIDELYDFVHSNVTHTAQARFPRPQTPVRVVRTGIKGVPVVVRLQPQTLRQLLADIAEQLSHAIEERQLKKVGVLEFTNDTAVGELLGANYGGLGKWCADELERRLMANGKDKFSVVDRRRLQTALRKEGFQLDDLGSGSRLKQISQDVGGMPLLTVGTLGNRKGRIVNISCKLQNIESDEQAGAAGGTALLNESEWAMLGRSVEIKSDDRRTEVPPPGVEAPPVEDAVVDHADKRSRGPHPLQDPNFKFPVKFIVNKKERKPIFKSVGEGEEQHTECFVPVNVGEVYELWIENRSGEAAMMRLLVDGLNTLPEKGEEYKGVENFVWGKKIMNLDEARSWLLDPAAPKVTKIKGIPTYAVRGFITETGEEGIAREFVVVDSDKSLAARRQFTDQIGLITAAFYKKSGSESRGSVGTDAGEARKQYLKEREAAVGNLQAVVHIRYVDAKTLNASGQK